MNWTKLAAAGLALSIAAFAAADAMAQRRDGKGPGRWEELGCRQVSFIGKDRDVIAVGRREGRFKAIRLKARGNDVELLDVRVVYANGQPDELRVRSRLRAGGETRPLDLKGRGRVINRIELTYKSRLNFKGLATVCAEGRD